MTANFILTSVDGWFLALDESIRSNVLTVAGFMARWSDVGRIVDRWIALKADLGLASEDELKHTFGVGHPVRGQLDAQGLTHRLRLPRMLDAVAQLPIHVLADTVVDLRSGGDAKDYYCDAMAWCVRRFANHVEIDLGRAVGPHVVYIDYPTRPSEFGGRDVSERVRAIYKYAGSAAFGMYALMYSQGETTGGFGRRPTPLEDLQFAPTIAAGHARHSDILQIADVIAGTVGDFCSHHLSDPAAPVDYRDHNVGRIRGRFREQNGRVATFGFGLWPPSHPNLDGLMQRVEGVSPPQGLSTSQGA